MAVLVGALALGGVAGAGGGLAAGGAGGAGAAAEAAGAQDAALGRAAGTRSVSGRSLNSGKQAARRGQHDEAWRRLGLRSVRRTVERRLECAVHSYGEVQRFFLRTPCRDLQRMLFVVGDGEGNTVVVSVAWVRMRSTGNARQLQKLADTYGTGNVSPIAGAALEVGGIRFTGRYYASRRSRSLVVIAEAEPAGGSPSAEQLHAAADVAALFPPPP